jgi:hypothetical protein
MLKGRSLQTNPCLFVVKHHLHVIHVEEWTISLGVHDRTGISIEDL